MFIIISLVDTEETAVKLDLLDHCMFFFCFCFFVSFFSSSGEYCWILDSSMMVTGHVEVGTNYLLYISENMRKTCWHYVLKYFVQVFQVYIKSTFLLLEHQ